MTFGVPLICTPLRGPLQSDRNKESYDIQLV